jgi:hypothetical protein
VAAEPIGIDKARKTPGSASESAFPNLL